jgi:3-phenylpropionate/cinnamic acid dioxygenase small subunit
MQTNDCKLATLMDRLEIEQVLVRYSTLIDTKQFTRLAAEVFTLDAVVDYTRAPGGIAGSVAEVTAWLSSVLQPFKVLQHMLGNFDITVDGDRARSICYFHNPMGLAAEGDTISMFWCGGRYRDELVRTPQGWRIKQRIDEVLYMHGLPTG